jgi:hypothetical protein
VLGYVNLSVRTRFLYKIIIKVMEWYIFTVNCRCYICLSHIELLNCLNRIFLVFLLLFNSMPACLSSLSISIGRGTLLSSDQFS